MGRGKKKRNPPLPPNTAADGGGATPSDSNPNQEERCKIDQDSSIESGCQAAVTEHSGGKPPLPQNTVTGCGGATPPDSNPNKKQGKIDQDSLIDAECKAAIAVHECGNHAEALRLMNETCRRYESCGLVHAAWCKLHDLEASRIGASDRDVSRQHLRSAVESARRAVSLSPNPVEFGTIYAESLYRLSNSPNPVEFEEVMRGHERALSLENPLLHCTDASLSFKAKVLKEKSDLQSFRSESENFKIGKLRSYWNAMSDERKMGLIEFRIGDLKDYYKSLRKNRSAKRVLSEGIGYAQKNKTWKFWACYYCDEKFQDFGSRLKHIKREHEGGIGQDLQMKPFLFTEIGESEVYDNLLANGTVYVTDMERIILTGDSSCRLDDRLLRVEVEYGSASTCDAQVAVPPDIDAFTEWLFDVPRTSTAEELAEEWLHLKDRTKHNGMEVPKRFEGEFVLFQRLRTKQRELILRCRSLRAIQTICSKELWERKEDRNHVRQRYESLMKKMLERDVNYAEEGSMFPTRRSQCDAIMGVIREAIKIRDLNNTGSGSNLLISSEGEDQEDASIRTAFKNMMQQALSELCTNEARITRSNGVLWRLLVRYKQASLDYRGIMLDLMRNFIHAKLEKEISEAVFEELFPEVSLDTKKSTSKGNIHPKLSKKPSKAKNKIKDHRKVEDSKATCSNEVTVEKEEKIEQACVTVAAASADELKLQEEKLREKLEYQRQFEDEAKQKALAKETTDEAAPKKVEEVNFTVEVAFMYAMYIWFKGQFLTALTRGPDQP